MQIVTASYFLLLLPIYSSTLPSLFLTSNSVHLFFYVVYPQSLTNGDPFKRTGHTHTPAQNHTAASRLSLYVNPIAPATLAPSPLFLHFVFPVCGAFFLTIFLRGFPSSFIGLPPTYLFIPAFSNPYRYIAVPRFLDSPHLGFCTVII